MSNIKVISQDELDAVRMEFPHATIKVSEGSYTVTHGHYVASGTSHVVAKGTASVWAHDSACVTSHDYAQVSALGHAKVRASGMSCITARDKSQIEAGDFVSVVAKNKATVIAQGRAHVNADNSVQVKASASASVTALGSSQVIATERVRVVARDRAKVEAWNSTHVEAWDNAYVDAWDTSRVVAMEASRVVAAESAHVEAWNASYIIAASHVSVHRYGESPTVIGGIVIQVNQLDTPEKWCQFYGLSIENGVVVLYKAVDCSFTSPHGTAYTPGTIPVALDWDGGLKECGGGLHFSPHPMRALTFYPEASRFVACPVAISDIAVHPNGMYPQKVKAKGCCRPVWECDLHGNRINPSSSEEKKDAH